MSEFAKTVASFREHIENNFPVKLHIEASQFKRVIFYTVTMLDDKWLELPGFVVIVKVKPPDSLYCCTHLVEFVEFKKELSSEERRPDATH